MWNSISYEISIPDRKTSDNKGMTILMDYEGYTFVFFIKKINKFFLLKCDIYYAFTFQPSKNLFKMQVAYICFNKIKGK